MKQNFEKKQLWKIQEDGIYSHIEIVYLSVGDNEGTHFGYHATFSDAKKELVQMQERRLEDARDALHWANQTRKAVTISEWDDDAKKRAGL